jgi:arylsulfate sulfotransferase
MNWRIIVFFCLGATLSMLSGCLSDDEQLIFGGEEVSKDFLIEDSIVVTLNPFDIAPLGASVSFTTKTPCAVEVRVLGDVSLKRSYDTLKLEHQVPVIGLYPDRQNEVLLTVIDQQSNFYQTTLTIQTGALPDFLPDVEILVANEAAMEPGWTLSEVGLGEGSTFRPTPIIYDHTGTIRWFMDLDFLGGLVFPIKQLRNGNMLISRADKVYEYSLIGERLRTWNIPGNIQHHEILEKPNGNLIIAVNKPNLTTVEDHIIEIDRQSGTIVNEWDMRQILDVDRLDLVPDPVDWFHMNAIFYDEIDDCLIISGRNQGVVKVTSNNLLVWILAPHRGWGRAGLDGNGHETSDYLLTAIDASGQAYSDSVQLGAHKAEDFDWVWGQHAPLILPNGNVFIFDNGFNRLFGNDMDAPYSRGVEYEIDKVNMTVRQVWQYGRERGAEMFSPIISDVDYHLETTNRMISSGICEADPGPGYARIVEVTYPDKQVVFEAKLSFKNVFSDGTLDWGQLDLSYRSERINLEL